MPDPCEYLYESVGCADQHSHGQTFTLEEFIGCADVQTNSAYTLMFETVGTANVLGQRLTARGRIEETSHAQNVFRVGVTQPRMDESIGCTNLFALTRTFTITETVNAAHTVTPRSNLFWTVAETAGTTDAYRGGGTYHIQDTVGVADTHTFQRYTRYVMAETIGLTSVYPSVIVDRVAVAVNEFVNAAVTLAHQATMSAAIRETVSFAEEFWFRSKDQLAWQMNTETTAVSWNTNFMFDSIAQYGNTVLAVAPDGVYILDGELDQTDEIDATVKTGFMDFDDRKVKRLGSVYFGLRGSSMRLSLEPFGAVTPSEYDMTPRTILSPGSSRITPGKGLISRYWRMTFKNVDGGDFDVDNIELDIASSTQRRL